MQKKPCLTYQRIEWKLPVFVIFYLFLLSVSSLTKQNDLGIGSNGNSNLDKWLNQYYYKLIAASSADYVRCECTSTRLGHLLLPSRHQKHQTQGEGRNRFQNKSGILSLCSVDAKLGKGVTKLGCFRRVCSDHGAESFGNWDGRTGWNSGA